MARHSKTGVRGLFRRVRYLHPDTGARLKAAELEALRAAKRRPVEAEAWEIDLRWEKADAGGRMVPHRYSEQLADGIKPAGARARTLEILNSIAAGTFDPDAAAPIKLHAALDAYLQWSEVNRPKTHGDRESIARRIKAGLSDMPLDALSGWHVEGYKRKRSKDAKQRRAPRTIAAGESPQTVGPATINREIAMLKHFAGLAASGMLPGVRLDASAALALQGAKMLREPPGRVRSLAPDEERRMLATLPDGLRRIVEAADLTGMRRAEVALLRREQVNLDAGEIVLTVTKTNKVRTIPINADLRALLVAAMAEAAGDYVFPSRRGLPYSLDAISRGFHRAAVKAGVSDLHFHDLRHDAATKLRRRGHGLDVIQKLLGHAQIATTARYAHVEPALLRAAVADLPGMQRPTPGEAKAGRARKPPKRKAGKHAIAT